MKWADFLKERTMAELGFKEPDYEKGHTHTKADEVNGGLEPENAEELERYKNADLITLPPNVPGTNCGNCSEYKELHEGLGFCEKKVVRLYVNPRMCCKFWDNKGVKRSWGDMVK